MSTQIRGQQIRLATLSRGHVDAAFEAFLAQLQTDVTTIYTTMSTDQERLDAISAITDAWQTADGDLQAAITSMVNAAKAGVGLEPDGTFVLPDGQNFLTGATTVKGAIGKLDSALKAEQDARIADVTQLNSDMAALAAAGAGTAAADLAAAVATLEAADAANAAAITNEHDRAVAIEDGLRLDINNEVAARTLLNTTLSTAIANEASARDAAVSTLAASGSAADVTLQNNINAEALERATQDTILSAGLAQEITDRTSAITQEITDRTAADAALGVRISALEVGAPNSLSYDKYVNRETPVGDIDGVNAEFVLAYAPHVGTEMVFLNGMLLEPGEGNDYTIDGVTITLAAAPLVGDRLKATYFR